MNTSVSALVRDALNEIAGSETEFERLRAEEKALRQRLVNRDRGFSARARLPRDESEKADVAVELLDGADLALSVQVLQGFYVQATHPRRSDALPGVLRS